MSGLGELGGLPGAVTQGTSFQYVQQRDIDQYLQYYIIAPSVDTAFIGTVNSATASAIVVFKNYVPDYPRNIAYSVTGVAGGMGGTFDMAGYDQFGKSITEHVVIGSAAGGGTTQGTAVWGSFTAATVSPVGLGGTAIGTFAIGFGTAAGATGNWFGLPTKILGTQDVRGITWVNNATPTGLNKGTNIGSLVSANNSTTPPYAFQGTSGVANTDKYIIEIKTQYDNVGKGIECAL